jgi:hypothetical protein
MQLRARAPAPLVLLASLCACGQSATAPASTATEKAAGKAAGEAAPASTIPAVAPAAVDLGQDRRDPPWFRPDAIAGTTVFRSSRTEADEQGRFSSQLILDFPAGTTVDACADQLRELVQPHVPDLAPTVSADGRVTLRGKTPAYGVTLLCGAVSDKVRAYVGYAWTQ